VRSHFELGPAEYERGRQGHLHRRRAALVARDVAERAKPGDLVVELGCGPGDILATLARDRPDLRFLGLDVDERMIEYAQSTHASDNAAFRLQDVSATPLDEQARVVFGIDILHHVHAIDRFVDGVARLLEQDGIWTVIEPNSRNPYIWLHQERMRRAGLDEDHFHRGPFEREASRSGLRLVGSSTAFVVPGTIQSVPRLVARAERLLERLPVLGGSVVYRLEPA
jgi:2-polyprenyl-3-methyl-5-hydroxy-6-metoxy-1,4-benzoquinol methylase